MASAFIVALKTPTGGRRYEVRARLGGRESRQRYYGRFRTHREAELRRRWVADELAAGRVPELRLGDARTTSGTVREASGQWLASRHDLAANTLATHRKALAHVLKTFGNRQTTSVTAAEISAWVGNLTEILAPGSVAKALGALRMVLDHAAVEPNPARDRRVRLPRQAREEIEPPSAAEVAAILGTVAPRYRLPLVVLEATAMRIGELEALRWGDLDLHGLRWRVARQHEKGRRGRFVNVPPDVFAAVDALVPREDRDLQAAIFGWLDQARLRTEMARACRAGGVPLYSPHDLRHRRISLWHLQGVPWAQIGAWVGQRDLAVTANVYSHVLVDGELDRTHLLR